MVRQNSLAANIVVVLTLILLVFCAFAGAQDSTGRPTRTPKPPRVNPSKNPPPKVIKTPPPAPTVIFTVLTEPAESEVILNGNRRGVSNAEGKFVIEKLALGQYLVEVKKEGFHPGSRIFNAGTESPTLVFKLEPALEDVVKEFDELIAAGNLLTPDSRNALQLVTQLSEKYPTRPEILRMRGVLATKLIDTAQPTILNSVKNWRKVAQDEMAHALAAATKATELKSEDLRIQAEAAYLRAIVALRNWQTVGAADGLTTAQSELDKVLTLDASYAPAVYQTGIVKLYANDLSGAEAAFVKTLQMEPQWFVGYTGMGAVYYETKRYKESIEAYRKAVALNPTSAAALAGVGLARAVKGDKDGIKDMERAVQLDATSGVPNLCLGMFFAQSKKSKERNRAVQEFKTAIQKNAGNLEFQNVRAEQFITDLQKRK
ncbi:MAG: tetratricopeptide repeat protein [Acidobacteria bacterium]|nr:tetratricopeptide repeat protein [Acidobacteriota bacterium]